MKKLSKENLLSMYKLTLENIFKYLGNVISEDDLLTFFKMYLNEDLYNKLYTDYIAKKEIQEKYQTLVKNSAIHLTEEDIEDDNNWSKKIITNSKYL